MKLIFFYILIFFISFFIFLYFTFPYQIFINLFNYHLGKNLNLKCEKIIPKFFLKFYFVNTNFKYENILDCHINEILLSPSLFNFFLINNELKNIKLIFFSSNNALIENIKIIYKIKNKQINGSLTIDNCKIYFLDNLINLKNLKNEFSYSLINKLLLCKIKSNEINGEIKFVNSQMFINLKFDDLVFSQYPIIKQIIPVHKLNNNIYTDIINFN